MLPDQDHETCAWPNQPVSNTKTNLLSPGRRPAMAPLIQMMEALTRFVAVAVQTSVFVTTEA
eukprot:243684-Chlamydomonas_euryale.AAC.1